ARRAPAPPPPSPSRGARAGDRRDWESDARRMPASLKDRLRRRVVVAVGRALGRPAGARLSARPRVLLIRPDHLGDVLLAGAGIARLRAALPEAYLTEL